MKKCYGGIDSLLERSNTHTMGCYFSQRYIFAIMAHLGVLLTYALRVNISVALVAMVSTNSTNSDKKSSNPECHSGKNTTSSLNNGEFHWNENDQGLILASFFYGYLLTQLPGGFLANKFGGKYVFGFGMLVASIFSLLTPIAAKTNFYLLIAARVLMGIGEGVTLPALHALISQWSPPADRSKFVGYTFSGTNTGTILSLPISSLLAGSTFLGGWPSVFYVFGTLGIVWFFLWLFLVFNNPNEHPYIREAERNFLNKNQPVYSLEVKNMTVPWFSIFSSLHVWAILIAHFSNNWVWYMVLTGLPKYFKDVLDFKLTENGFLSALPFIAAFIVSIFIGWFSDFIRKKKCTTTFTRRFISAIGFYPSAVFLILASYSSCSNIAWSVSCMVLATAFLAFNGSGYLVNHLDISPRFGGILMGLSNTLGTVAGCITPSVTGYFTNGDPSSKNYRSVFFIAAAICLFGGTFFIAFLSGEVQPWNNVNDEIYKNSRFLEEQEKEKK
ncbi:sialin isoform X1 [Hydra vulgaris]|uniref:sialin isoform X1 n=2 Tax=Hydra vulgaris TaxID=6087 RepID=UPI001F5ED7C6|nr:sialin isoform X1 [Hydra vulgaris]